MASSTDRTGLLSSGYRWKILPPKLSLSVAGEASLGLEGGLKCCCCIGALNLSFTWFIRVQGRRNEVRPFCSTFVLNTFTLVGLWAPLRHTSPAITQPKSSLGAHGVLCGPLYCSRTLCTLRISLPNNRSTGTLVSSGRILSATGARLGKYQAI